MAVIIGGNIVVNGLIVGTVEEYRDNSRILVIK